MPKQHENDPRMTSSPEFHQITLMVGGLKQAVETMTEMWRAQEVDATAGRRALHQKVESLQRETSEQISKLASRLDHIDETLRDVEPAVRSFRDEKLRQEGAKRLGGKLIAGMMAVSGAIGWGLHEFITYIRH